MISKNDVLGLCFYILMCVCIYIFTQLLQLTFKYGSKLSVVGAKWKMCSYY